MDDCLSKPFKQEQLETLLQRWFPGGENAADQLASVVEIGEAAIDFAVIDQLRENVGDVVDDIIVNFITATRERVSSMRRAATNGEVDTVFLEAHSLKSSSALLGANQLSKHCLLVEGKTKKGVMEEVAQHISSIESEFERVCDALAVRGYREV